MNTKGKVRISIEGDTPDGYFSGEERIFLADAAMHVLDHGKVAILELHIVMPQHDVQNVMKGIQRAGVELWLEDMTQVPDLD
ncbi:MAG TPA: hypothetical protein VMT28_09995 [Terriglobales bacterium]|jgi:hypothetical protein|nr:hypothetical protein [Terriglobales bacterium]